MNKLRIRDTIGEDLNLFEVHKLEDVGVGVDGNDDTNSAVIMRLESQSESEKNDWVKSINTEIKQLRTMAKALSSKLMLMS